MKLSFICFALKEKNSTKTSREYGLLKNYGLKRYGEETRLVRLDPEHPTPLRYKQLIDSDDDDIEEGFFYVVPLEDMFDTLLSVHKNLAHGRRDAMRTECSKTYSNLTCHIINCEIFA